VDKAPWFNDRKIERGVVHLLNGAINLELLQALKDRTGYKLQSEFDTYTMVSFLVSAKHIVFQGKICCLSRGQA
jgi:hypothetical protein